MHRFVLDSNALDPFLKVVGGFESLESAVADARIELLYTHITIDELAAIPDINLRSMMILSHISLGKLIPTGGAALDYSRLNFCRISDDNDAQIFEELRSMDIVHTRDALIAATARFERADLITNDKRLAARAVSQGITVVKSKDLADEVGFSV